MQGFHFVFQLDRCPKHLRRIIGLHSKNTTQHNINACKYLYMLFYPFPPSPNHITQSEVEKKINSKSRTVNKNQVRNSTTTTTTTPFFFQRSKMENITHSRHVILCKSQISYKIMEYVSQHPKAAYLMHIQIDACPSVDVLWNLQDS